MATKTLGSLHLLLLLTLSLLPTTGQKAPPPRRCVYCTDTCDRLHDQSTGHFKCNVNLPVDFAISTTVANILKSFEAKVAHRINDDGGQLYGARTCNLVHYTWSKVKQCMAVHAVRGTSKTNLFKILRSKLWAPDDVSFSLQLERIIQLLLDYRLLHTDAHCASHICLQESSKQLEQQCDPTMSIEGDRARAAIQRRHLFGWDGVTVEQSFTEECLDVNLLTFIYSNATFTFKLTVPRYSLLYTDEQLANVKRLLLEKAEMRFIQEQVRQDLDADVQAMVEHLCRSKRCLETFFQRLRSSLLAIRSEVPDNNNSVINKAITANNLRHYLKSIRLWQKCKQNDQLDKWFLKAPLYLTASWFNRLATIDSRILESAFYGPVSRKLSRYFSWPRQEQPPTGAPESEEARRHRLLCRRHSAVTNLTAIFKAIEEDFNTDRGALNAEDQILTKYYTKILLVAAKDSLVDESRHCGPKMVMKISGGLTLAGAGIFGLYNLYKFINPAINGMDFNSSTTKLPNLTTYSLPSGPFRLATTPSPYASLVNLLILLASIFTICISIAGCYYLHKDAQRFSSISIDSEEAKTAIRAGLSSPKRMTMTNSSRSAAATLK